MVKQRAVDYVNVFWGSEVFKKQSDGKLSGKWFFLKPQIGNLSPACHLPNSAFCVVPYSGGYPAGYGIYNPSYGSVPTQMSKEKFIKGFTHFAPSGTGYIENFYNYFMICPSEDNEKVLAERGGCGWYETDTLSYRAKVALDGFTANYEFELTKGNTFVTVLPGYGGLDNQSKRCKQLSFNYTAETRECALIFSVDIEGMPLYFALASKNKFTVHKEDGGRYKLNFDKAGVSLSVSYSLVSPDEAYKRLNASCFNYDKAKNRAEEIWEKELAAVEIKSDEKTKTLFYTALYNAQKKPCIEDGFIYPVFDLATMWDIYKTQLPLVYFLYPDRAKEIVNGFLKCFNGKFFLNSKLMEARIRESRQAICLIPLCIATAYLYEIDADYDKLLPLAKKDIEFHAKRSKFFRPFITHNLDFLDAYYALLNCGVKFSEDIKRAVNFREQRLYNKKELLKRGLGYKYYEGTNINYSFRVSSSTERRLNKCNKNCIKEAMDSFFGFVGDDVINFTSPAPYRAVLRRGKRYRRFEGLNNETDMEAMFMYHKLHEYGKCEDILNEIINNNFDTANGGLCGNDDSGALTSWLSLNILGLYPVPGTSEILICSPQADEVNFMWKNKLTIKTTGRAKGKHIAKVILNGKELKNRQTDLITLKQGGELVIEYN